MEKQRAVLLKNIEKRRMEAGFNGIIGKLNLTQGAYAKAQDIFGYLIDRTYLKATVEVVETDASRIKVGQKAVLTFPAYPNLRVEAVVISYPAVGRITTRGATVLDTKIRIDNPPDKILPGYSFTGEIISGEDERILLVESAAIAYENGKAYVERFTALKGENGGPVSSGQGSERPGPPAFRSGTPGEGAADLGPPERVFLEVVPYSRNMVKILSGLNAGDRVKAQRLEDGFSSPEERGGAMWING
jgi:multidrug efflux pump subunit AcrA (membrane-fusion protein)